MAKTILNTLIVFGERDRLKRLQESVRRTTQDGNYITHLSLENYLPMPSKLLSFYPQSANYNIPASIQEELYNRYGVDNWRDWRLLNWDTTHDIIADKPIWKNGSLIYEFESEWSSPVAGIKKISRAFSSLVFVLSYTDIYLGITGKSRIQQGHANIHLYEQMDTIYCPRCEDTTYRNINGECFACRYNFEEKEIEE